MFPQFIIDKVVKNYLDKTFTTPQNVCESDSNNVRYFKLPYMGKYSNLTQAKLISITNKFCKSSKIILVFVTSFKIKNFFSAKNEIPRVVLYGWFSTLI